MRVLDGTGSGVLAFHAAEFVGPSGTVIGTDLAIAGTGPVLMVISKSAIGPNQTSLRKQGRPHILWRGAGAARLENIVFSPLNHGKATAGLYEGTALSGPRQRPPVPCCKSDKMGTENSGRSDTS
jgi:hypothetical protein